MSATPQSSPPSKAAGRTEATPAVQRKSGAGSTSGGRKEKQATGTARAQAKPARKKKLQAEPAGDRHRMIAEAAYFRAERRGFADGGQVDDWLEAEAEIDGQT